MKMLKKGFALRNPLYLVQERSSNKNENQFELKTKHILKTIGPHFAIFQFAYVPKSFEILKGSAI